MAVFCLKLKVLCDAMCQLITLVQKHTRIWRRFGMNTSQIPQSGGIIEGKRSVPVKLCQMKVRYACMVPANP